jgi:glycosyltransferase involved in cell wall biosynthesis
MTIGFHTSLFMPSQGSAELFLQRLVGDLQARGHNAVVVAPTRQRHLAAELPFPFIRSWRPRSKRYFVGNALPQLLYAHLRHGIEVLHCHGEYRAACSAYQFHKFTGVPYICHALGSDFATVEHYPRLQRKMCTALSKVSMMVAQGSFLRHRMMELGIPESKITIAPAGVDVDGFRACFKPDTPMIPSPYILYAGGLRRSKGFDLLLRAFSHVADEFPDVKLLLVGNNRRIIDFETQVAELHLGERAMYLGACSHEVLAELMGNCLFCAAPARRAPFSVVNLEAMAAGVPLLLTAVDGNCEQITDGEEGFLVPVGDVKALAAGMRRLLSDERLRENMGAKAFARASDFSWANTVSAYEACYKQVAGKT